MSRLLDSDPFGPRRDNELLDELNALTQYHREGCPEYARLLPEWRPARRLEELPYVHAGVFKRLVLKTQGPGIHHQRTLSSSSTSGAPTQIALDDRSVGLQAKSVQAIHRRILGGAARPLLILDDSQALRQGGRLPARLAAALSLQSLASETVFLLEDLNNPASLRWGELQRVLAQTRHILLYGTTWNLWRAWGESALPAEVAALMQNTRIDFVHSGGWKKLESSRVDRSTFEKRLLARAAAESQVVDYYGLSEQVGILFPMCAKGRRHAPVWADIVVRDAYTREPLENQSGLLQLVNPLAWGAPYHSVLTEDLGRRLPGNCACGLPGRHFELLGRVPQSEMRGCGNV